jgi:glycosyltransferase involved in cell wall biosynthesis
MTPRPSQLSVALDATLWDEPTTGIGLYTRNLARALENQGVEIRRLGARISGENPRGAMSASAYVIGRLPGVLEDIPEPLYHGVCNFNLPLTRVPGKRMVLTVHDAIPVLLPNTVSTAYRWQFRLWLARSLRVADRVICDSARTKADLLSHFDTASDNVEVVHLGVDHVDSIPPPDALGQAYLQTISLPPEFVLYAGALDVRKNIDCLLDAVELLWSRGEKAALAVVGQSWFGSTEVERRIASLQARGFEIRMLGYQAPSIFYELMRRATAFVFPSRYEGFGLPPLEAMHLGVPVIISNSGALPEICGGAAVQVDPDNPLALANALIQLLKSPAERASRAEAGRRWAARYTWQRTARRTIAVYRSVLGQEVIRDTRTGRITGWRSVRPKRP